MGAGRMPLSEPVVFRRNPENRKPPGGWMRARTSVGAECELVKARRGWSSLRVPDQRSASRAVQPTQHVSPCVGRERARCLGILTPGMHGPESAAGVAQEVPLEPAGSAQRLWVQRPPRRLVIEKAEADPRRREPHSAMLTGTQGLSHGEPTQAKPEQLRAACIYTPKSASCARSGPRKHERILRRRRGAQQRPTSAMPVASKLCPRGKRCIEDTSYTPPAHLPAALPRERAREASRRQGA